MSWRAEWLLISFSRRTLLHVVSHLDRNVPRCAFRCICSTTIKVTYEHWEHGVRSKVFKEWYPIDHTSWLLLPLTCSLDRLSSQLTNRSINQTLCGASILCCLPFQSVDPRGSTDSYITTCRGRRALKSTYTEVVSVTPYIKLSLCFNWAPHHEGVVGEWRCSSIHSLTSALDGGEWSASRPGRFTPKERDRCTYSMGARVGPRAVLDAVVKREIFSPLPESNPISPIVQPVAQRYIDWAITALSVGYMGG
jgi:hypothetical protein